MFAYVCTDLKISTSGSINKEIYIYICVCNVYRLLVIVCTYICIYIYAYICVCIYICHLCVAFVAVCVVACIYI